MLLIAQYTYAKSLTLLQFLNVTCHMHMCVICVYVVCARRVCVSDAA